MPTIQFKGKSFVQNHHLSVPYHQLVPNQSQSLTDKVSLQDNLIIHGDNLLALKALLPTYAGKIKCIYIDPPYNTGNEGWVYNDRVNSPFINEWIGKVVGKEGEDFTRHDKWLCMMMPRLKLLRELLADDGVIFVSIDDNENAHLKVLMNEIFMERNFVTDFIWHHRKSSQNDIDFSLSHNYTLCFAKSREKFKLNSLGINEESFSNPDNDPRGEWTADPMDAPNVRPNLTYVIKNPNTGAEYLPPQGRHWRTTEDKFLEALADNRVVWGKSGKARPQLKRFKKDAEISGTNPFTIWSDVPTATDATNELMDIFEGEKVFNTPKPVGLIKRILQLAANENSIVLDSFAGSGTTAQAVLELNKEDGGNRKFILVETEDYAETITAERVRRVIKGVPNSRNENLKEGLGGTFSYFDLGGPIEISSILSGESMPSYLELARYLYYTATGEEFIESNIDEPRSFIGSSSQHDIYMFYKPDIEYLKQTAMTLGLAREMRETSGHRSLLVFAPTKYVETSELDNLKITFCQLPFELYKVNHGAS